MVKRTEAPKRVKGVRTKSLKRVTNVPSKTLLADMNDDCLTAVFDYLDVSSLVRVAKTSQRLKNIVTDRVVPSKTVQFDHQQSSTRKAFEVLGGSMTRISVKSDDIQMTKPGYTRFSEFLRLLTIHGTPGKLQQLTLTGFTDEYGDMPPELLDAARPFFENMHTLTVNMPESFCTASFFNKLMSNIPMKNLRHLCLHNIRLVGEWLSIETLPNLQSFHLCMGRVYLTNYENTSIERVKKYIQEKPQLTTFDYVGKSQEALLIEVSRHIPNVTRIGTIKNMMVFQPIGQDDNNNNNGPNWNRQGYRAKWKFLNEFKNLNHFSLESHAHDFNDCGEIFRILAGQNTIEHLELFGGHTYENGTNPVEFNHVRQMTNVKSLRLTDFGRHHSDEFVGQLFENLTELQKCTIHGSQLKQTPIIKLVQNGRKLRSLKMTSLTPKFYQKLVKTRKLGHPDLVGQPLIVWVPKTVFDSCKEELTSRTYKPSIVALKST